MTLNVSDIINDPDVGISVIIMRTAAPTLANGRAGAETYTSTGITASVQPMPTRELEFMPEGLRNQGIVQVFCMYELYTMPMPDRFTYLSATWEIIKVDDWNSSAGYWHALATRVTQT